MPPRLALARPPVPLIALVALALVGPYLARWSPRDVDVTAFGAPPSARHWFGTTPSGRDMFALTSSGTRRSLLIGLSAALGASGLAAVVGVTAGHSGGWADLVLTQVTDLVAVLPPFLVAAVASPALRGRGPVPLALLLAGLMWPGTSRAIRAAAAGQRGHGYLLAATQTGAPARRIILRHVLPNAAAPLVADAALHTGTAIGVEAGLSCLGLGAQPPDTSLGILIAAGAPAATTTPWLFLPPVTALVLIALAVYDAGARLRAVPWRGHR